MKLNLFKKIRNPYLKVYAKSDVGKKRKENEDSISFLIPTDINVRKEYGSIFVVADGVGGLANGKIASKLTCRSLIKSYFLQPRELSVDQRLRRAIEKTNEIVLKKAQELNSPEMASTVTAAVFLENEVYVANVGDSRTYLINPLSNEPIKQITRDHSLVETQVRKGLLSKDEAENAKNKNIITRAIGMDKKILVDIFRVPLTEKSKFLLTTDGLVRVVKDSKIYETIHKNKPSVAINKLVKLANDNGGPDNITVCLVEKLTPSLLPYILIPSVIAAILLAGYFGFPYIKNIIYPPKTNVELVEPLNDKKITPDEFTNFKKNGLTLSWEGLPIADNYHLYVCQLGEDKEGKEVEDSIFGKDKLFDTVKPKTEQNKDNSKEIKDNKNNNDSKEHVITYTIPGDKLFKGFTYCWYVVPVNSKGKELNNNKSNKWNFTTPPLEKPELTEPANNQKNVSLNPTFKWKAKDEDSIDEFRLYVREEDEGKPLLVRKEFKTKELKKDSSTQEFSYLLSPNEKLDYNKTYIWNIEVVKHSINGKFQINIKGEGKTFTTVEKPTTTTPPSSSSPNTGGSKAKPQPPETGKLVLNFDNTLFNKTLKVLIDGKVEKASFTPTSKDKSFTIDKLNQGKYKFRIELIPSGWFYEKEITITKGKDTPLTIAKSNFKINVTIELTFSKEVQVDNDNKISLILQKKNEVGEWENFSSKYEITIKTYKRPFTFTASDEGNYRLYLYRGGPEKNTDYRFTLNFGEKPSPQTIFNNITLKVEG
jgi:protein phosphatase